MASVTLGMDLLPVTGKDEAGQLLKEMFKNEVKKSENALRVKLKEDSKTDDAMIEMVRSAPGITGQKATELLSHFGTVSRISTSSKAELEKIVGSVSADSLYKFFNG